MTADPITEPLDVGPSEVPVPATVASPYPEHLEIRVGGESVRMRELPIGQSDAWKRLLAEEIASIDIPGTFDDGASAIHDLLVQPARRALRLLRAFDRDRVLPEDLEARMTERELHAALEGMVRMEYPFDSTDTIRAVAMAFSEPGRILLAGVIAATRPQVPERPEPQPATGRRRWFGLGGGRA